MGSTLWIFTRRAAQTNVTSPAHNDEEQLAVTFSV
jgi:hypothetical protein